MELIEPNENMSQSYLKMAEESIQILTGVEKSRIWTATTTYYIFYYSLYAVMLRVGVKCEIHSCSLEFMKQCLSSFYSHVDIKMIAKAFQARVDLQYYANRPVDELLVAEVKSYCTTFFIKTKDILARMNKNDIEIVRKKLK